MHILLNNNLPVLEIETGRILNYSFLPYGLKKDKLTQLDINNWIIHRALKDNRYSARQIYEAAYVEYREYIKLMFITHSLSINDTYWICEDTELQKINFDEISLFSNDFSKELYDIAFNSKSAYTKSIISPEFTGQGVSRKCFKKNKNGDIYIYKNYSNITECSNEILACYIAEIIGCKTAHYQYEQNCNLDCTVSKILTSSKVAWEPAFNMFNYSKELGYTSPFEMAKEMYTSDYINMIILDALVLNMDRHLNNWSFAINTETNEILGLSPIYDYNKAFLTNEKTNSQTIYPNYNILKAARLAYQEYRTTLNIDYLYNIIDDIDIPINKKALKNRILYITGKRDNQRDCY